MVCSMQSSLVLNYNANGAISNYDFMLYIVLRNLSMFLFQPLSLPERQSHIETSEQQTHIKAYL